MPETATDTLSIREAAERLGVHVQTVRLWYHDGKITGRRIGIYGWIRIPISEIERIETPEYAD